MEGYTGMWYDVIVAGAGPAGCAAAISCMQQGLRVLIIPGSKSAGQQQVESVHPGLMAMLRQLGAAHCIAAATQGMYEGIAVNGIYNALGSDEAGPWQGHHISRAMFDEALLQCALAQGAESYTGDSVAELIEDDGRVTGLITSSGRQIGCRYLIDASGHNRIAAKTAGFKTAFYSPPLVAWTGVTYGIPATDVLFAPPKAAFTAHTSGWSWIAPLTAGRCAWTRLELKGKQQLLPPEPLQQYPLAGEIKSANRRWRASRPVCKEGLLLCGDAAGIIDPAAGQGILNAMLSAITAAKTIKSCITNPAFEALYLARYDEWFIDHYLDKVRLLKHFYKRAGVQIFS